MVFEFKLPDLGEGLHEAELVEWFVKEGEEVKVDQPIAKMETAKALVDVPSPKAGRILKLHAKPGQTVLVGETLVTILEPGEKPPKEKEIEPSEKPEEKGAYAVEELPKEEIVIEKPTLKEKEEKEEAAVLATPAVRRLAKELGVDITKIKGTGKGGMITKEDVISLKAAPPEKLSAQAQRITFEKWGSVLRIPLRGVRKTIAENMVRARRIVAHVTHMDEADVTKLVEIREQKKKLAEEKGFPITYLPFIMKACSIALKKFPYLNASIDEATNEIVVKQYQNIGIAVDTSYGLVVPNIKKADHKSIMELAKEMYELSEKARARELTIEEMQGGTFTITNMGTIGGTYATPIVNWPECAILGVGRIRDVAKPINGKIEIRKILPLSLSFDHRIVDGAMAARFVSEVIKHLEDPELLMVEAE